MTAARDVGELIDEQRVRSDASRHEGQADSGQRPVARRFLRSAPRNPGERRQHQDPVDARRRGKGTAEATGDPPSRAEAVEREHREHQIRALAVDDPEEERERKNCAEQGGALGAAARQIQARQVVDRDHRDDERRPRDDDAAEKQIAWTPSERAADIPHEQRIHGKVRDSVAPIGRVMESVARDLVIPPRVVPGERVPEQIRRAEHRKALILVIRKDDVAREREQGGDDAERDRPERDADHGRVEDEAA